jgi:hypothetical protein
MASLHRELKDDPWALTNEGSVMDEGLTLKDLEILGLRSTAAATDELIKQRDAEITRLYKAIESLCTAALERRPANVVIDVDAAMWDEIKLAIINSPRFAEMYSAGGMFNDGLENTVAWLKGKPWKGEPSP